MTMSPLQAPIEAPQPSVALAESRVPSSRDCADADPCTIDFWHEFREQCVHTADPYCTKECSADLDCAFADGLAPCTLTECVQGQCRYQPLALDECATCSDTSECPESFCEPRECTGGRCRKSKRDCSDDDPATWDTCDEAGQRCLHLLGDDLRRCNSAADCVTDHPCQQFECGDRMCRVSKESAD